MKKLRKNYEKTTAVLRWSTGLQTTGHYRSLQVTTGHYSHYRHYRFREKVTGFADATASASNSSNNISILFFSVFDQYLISFKFKTYLKVLVFECTENKDSLVWLTRTEMKKNHDILNYDKMYDKIGTVAPRATRVLGDAKNYLTNSLILNWVSRSDNPHLIMICIHQPIHMILPSSNDLHLCIWDPNVFIYFS